MPVYLIQAGDHGPVKIGHGANPARRLHNLQLGCPDRLRLLGTIPGGEIEEDDLHRRFADHRIRGEWFRFNQQMLSGMEAPPSRERRGSMSEHPIKRYREANNLTSEALAKRVGVSKATISRIESGSQNPSLGLIQRFVDRTDLRAEDFLRRVNGGPQRADEAA